ncbi:MAG: hypothetical protein C0598_14615 [Marinilabiliales bacterium]|nr:MAG: hypothetical protein C0598_14615 [Marinilabiliales bacterium]
MKDDLNYIDGFYKDNLKGYEASAETDVWGKIKWRLFWWRYKNYLMAGTIAALTSLAFIIPFTSDDGSINTGNPRQELTLQNINVDESTFTISVDEKPSEQNMQANTILKNDNDEQTQTTINTTVDEVEHTTHESNKPQTTAIQLFTASNNSNTAYITKEVDDSFDAESALFLNYLESADINFLNYMFPDTSLMGMNRRTDLISPGIKTQWITVNVFTGPAHNMSILKSDDSEYLLLRNSNEGNSNSFSFGADLKFHFQNFVITTGINYASYKQNRYYKNSYQVYNPEDSYYDYDTTWVYIYDPPDYGTPVISSIDSTWVEVYNDVIDDYSGINKVDYFEIPVMLGYRYTHKLLTFELNAGASAGFLVYSDFKAPSLSNHEDVLEIKDMNKTMFNFISNFSVYYQLNKTTSLFISPYYKQNLNSIYQENYPVNQKFKTFGLNFGVNVKF